MYHYKNYIYLKIVYIFTRIVYGLAFINFICQGLPIFQNYSVQIFYTIVFALILDFVICAYIIRYKNAFTKVMYLFQTFAPRALMFFGPSYAVYANTNPTHSISHFYHRHGPKEFGVLGVAPHSEFHLTHIDHIWTVRPHDRSIEPFLILMAFLT